MTAPATIALQAPHRALVLAILQAHLPPGSTVHVFGSRATGRSRPYSDLDLAIDATRPLTLDEHAELAEAFDDSDLPWKVDLIDTNAITPRFRQTIATQQLKLAEIVGNNDR